MVVIVESGSTKSDWLIFENGQLMNRCESMGFNPNFVSAEEVYLELKQVEPLSEIRDSVKQIFFFGAGCSAPSMNKKIATGLKDMFPRANIKVDHDLVAAAYATYDGRPAISCILGTGSNACYFDGNSVQQEVPSLAYILGDEGSGAYFGKKLLTAYFYKKLPGDIADDFRTRFPGLDKEVLIEKVYNSPRPNVYLAGFMPFVLRHKDADLVRNWIDEGFELFIENQILCYPRACEVPIHFVGSIASLLQEPLRECIEKNDLQFGNLLAKPAMSLAKFVLDRKLNT